MIGNANVFRFVRSNLATTSVLSLKPFGDLPGLYWGSVRPLLTLQANYDKPSGQGPIAWSALVTVEVAGVEVFRHRHVQRNWWRTRQLYQNSDFQNGQQVNFRWEPSQWEDGNANPTGVLIGNYTGFSNGAPKRSYMHAFFRPANEGPAAAPLAFTPGTNPNNPVQLQPDTPFWINPEPIWFTATVLPGQSFDLRVRWFREVPNANLNPPISDTGPGSNDAEPDEIEVTNPSINGHCEGWVIRTGPPLETLVDIAQIGVDTGVGLE
jgi:hypothetical protein